MSEADALLRLIGEKSKVNEFIGNYRGIDTNTKLPIVDVLGSRLIIDTITSFRPEINEPVWVFFIDGKPFMAGPTTLKPATGTVLTVNTTTGIARISTDIGVVPAPYGGTAPSSGQTVKLYWGDGPYVLSVASTSPPPQVVPPAPGGGGGIETLEFAALDSGQYGPNLQNNSLRASDSISSAYFYGTSVNDTLPDTIHAVTTEIYLPNTQSMGFLYYGLHNVANISNTFPGSLFTVPDNGGRSGWVRLEDNWGEYLAQHDAGISLTSGNGDSRWAGTKLDGQSGRLRIRFTR